MHHQRIQKSDYSPYQHASLCDGCTGSLILGDHDSSECGADLMMCSTRQNVLPHQDFPWSARLSAYPLSGNFAPQSMPSIASTYPSQLSSPIVPYLPPGSQWPSCWDIGSQFEQQSCHDHGAWLDLVKNNQHPLPVETGLRVTDSKSQSTNQVRPLANFAGIQHPLRSPNRRLLT